MGKVVVEKKKKKKGRPSLLDLQKRKLLQEQQLQQIHKQKNHIQFKKKSKIKTKKKNNNKIQNPSPNSSRRRSTRRNPNPNSDYDDEDEEEEEEDRSSGKRREKKLNQLNPNQDDDDDDDDVNSGSDSNHSNGSNLKKRKIDSIAPGSGSRIPDKGDKHGGVAANQASTQQGSKLDDGPITPLPDKKLLLFILERLQKKDTYGVFAEPVDPEELPDYHEVIQHPMDFSTVRKKLLDDEYANLEEFEKDILLICSNAMQYNAPDTIYFRQARAIQELAKKDFENLRQDSDNNEPEPEPEQKVARRGRPPTKHLKKPPGRPPLERANSNFSEATLATAGGSTNRSNNEQRKAPFPLEKYGSAELLARSLYASHHAETYIGWSAERFERTDDITGSASKGIAMKHGKKNIVLDESRRNTYKQRYALACRQEQSVLSTFDGERKQLIAVGLHTEHGYARSLSRFAAKLGPVAWKVASMKIQRCLPAGVKFGPGWVGENEAPTERPSLQQSVRGDSSSAPSQGIVESSGDRSTENPQEEQLSEAPTSKIGDGSSSSKALSPSAAGNEASPTPVCVTSSPVTPSNGVGSKSNASEKTASFHPNTTFNMVNSSNSAMRRGHQYPLHQSSNYQSRINGLNGSHELSFVAQMGKMIDAAAKPTAVNLQSSPSIVTVSRTETQVLSPPNGENNGCGEAKLSENSSSIIPGDCMPKSVPSQRAGSAPPDLNVGFQSPGSPGSGKADSWQPDLALQL